MDHEHPFCQASKKAFRAVLIFSAARESPGLQSALRFHLYCKVLEGNPFSSFSFSLFHVEHVVERKETNIHNNNNITLVPIN